MKNPMHHTWKYLAACCLGSLWIGCSADFPSGSIVCGRDPGDCPKGMTCRFEDDANEGLCFRGSGSSTRDSGPDDPEASTNEIPDGSFDDGGAGKAGSAGRPPQSDAGRGGTGGREAMAGGSGGRTAPAADSGRGGSSSASAGAGGRTTPAAGSGADSSDPCDDPARECEPDQVHMEDAACGDCDTGSHTHSRVCDPDTCTWGEWSAWTKCEPAADVCTPGEKIPRTVECACGSKRQVQVCSDACEYGTWTDETTCPACPTNCAEVVYCDTPNDVATNRGTWCRPLGNCNNDAAWANCLEDLEALGCVVHEPIYVGN